MLTVLSILFLVFEFLLYKPLLDPLFPKRKSCNVICTRKPKGEVKRRIVFCGHMDSAYEWTYLRKGGDERTHQIHIFAQTDTYNITRHLAVRDYLRAHPDEAAAYAALKIRLAAEYPYDIEGYCDGKDAFVRALEKRALGKGE